MPIQCIYKTITEVVILNRVETLLQTSSPQFRLNRKHVVELCVYVLFKELIICYIKHESAVPVGFIDASNFEGV